MSPGDGPAFRDGKTEILADIIHQYVQRSISRLLVVGCGSGIEAAILGRELNASVVGIDLNSSFNKGASAMADLRQGDATALQFEEGTFDFVFSYHALEHIPDYHKALFEMRRVLTEDGAYCIGTPNRSRLIGYLGSKEATTWQKLKWNCVDWSARARGRFRNEFGAHAGFTRDELQNELMRTLGKGDEITLLYYRRLYPRHEKVINLLEVLGMGSILFPSIYFIGSRNPSGQRAGVPQRHGAF